MVCYDRMDSRVPKKGKLIIYQLAYKNRKITELPKVFL